MSDAAQYGIPGGVLGLKGPMARPLPGTVALRGDLAHIALADQYLVAHYVVPQIVQIGSDAVDLKLSSDAASDTVAQLPAGSTFELLDIAGGWCWGCVAPEGPSGYILKSALATTDQ